MFKLLLFLIFNFVSTLTKANELEKFTEDDLTSESNRYVGNHTLGVFIPGNNTFKTAKAIYIKNSDWDFPIKYYISKDLSYSKARINIKNVIRAYEKLTCVTFEESSEPIVNGPGITFVYDSASCYSVLGKDPSNVPQEIHLLYMCAENFGNVAHEIGHALRLEHEHSRFDRDKYITIFENNLRDDDVARSDILDKNNDEFKTYSDIPYDYGSVMHYERFGYAKEGLYGVARAEGLETIKANNIDPYSWMMGQQNQISFSDAKHINYHYCDKKCKEFPKVECKNGGYRSYETCTRCICPRGYEGNYCERIKLIPGRCSDDTLVAIDKLTYLIAKGTLVAIDKLTYLIAKGAKSCNYLIKAKSDAYYIYLKFGYVHTTYLETCSQGNGLEIRHEKNKGTTGLCLCGRFYGLEIVSDSEEVYIEYHGRYPSNEFQLQFAQVFFMYTKPYLCWQKVCYEKKDNYYVKQDKNYRNYKIED
uniref:Metalloendopeptidase n=1 Tax=Parastrongyloides trichosuri TaxID=131310 RepID=A0A0N4ZGW2_PARTI